MAEKYIMIHDILSEHRDRMINIKKYYPFFVLSETTFTQYKDGRYSNLDMGYITMATLRFLIHENSFQEREVTYEEYEDFLLELLHREFLINEGPAEEHELCGYIFDKIKNDGKAFTFNYFDPEEKKKKTARVKLIDSRIVHGIVLYHVTTDGIEFYLDTKEIKDESNISVQQVLLEKMIRSENFAGGIEVVKRINNEVSKLSLQKKEVLDLLSYDIMAGAKASEEYMATVAKWFREESKLFEKNRALIDKAFAKANEQGMNTESGENVVLSKIHKLDTELKKTIIRHGELIRETIELQNIADEMIGRAKLRKLRPVFDFRNALEGAMKRDRIDDLSFLIAPMLMPRLNKTFNAECIDRMLEGKTDNGDYGEKVEKKVLDPDFVYEDEIEDKRISKNYGVLYGELLEQLWKHGKTTLSELIAIYEIKFGKDIYNNGDLYSFFVHLAQKDSYDLSKMATKQDTFLEGIIMEQLSAQKKDRFGQVAFNITFDESKVLSFGPNEEYSITDMNFVMAS
ncbi:MAG: hypothetical protein E7271_05585 [Lachnospiraceae bacterium]|jgi:hypothetical protein|nr:hypothetical protein [Lachnospiraceae bacterium]